MSTGTDDLTDEKMENLLQKPYVPNPDDIDLLEDTDDVSYLLEDPIVSYD